MTNEEYLPFIYDPNLVQNKSYELLNKALDGKLDITNPTNPFSFLLENQALLTSSLAKEIEVTMRTMYPSLSTKKEHLYHHLNTSEIVDIFAIPSKAYFNILINKNDLVTFGNSGDDFTEIVLPKFSTVTVNEVTFTLLNDILVRYYEHGKVFSKILFSDLDIAVQKNDILKSEIVKDDSNNDWILITIELVQIKKFTIRDTLMVDNPYKKLIKLDDRFSFIEARSIFKYSNEISKLDITLSNFVYDPNKPTMIVQPREEDLLVEIPPIYVSKGILTNFIELDIYTTKGELYLNLNKYKPSDFQFELNLDNTEDIRKLGTSNINYVVSGLGETFGGRNEIEFEDLKEKIINYSTGDNSLPITEKEVKTLIEKHGFEYKGQTDTLFKRNFLITKHIDYLDFDLFATMDFFTDIVKVYLPNVQSKKIKEYKDAIIIEPYQVFRKDGNNIIPLSDSEIEKVKNDALNDINSYNKDILFFNIHKYVIDYNNLLKVRAYEVNTPSISNLETTFNNNKLVAPVVINDITIIPIETGYRITVDINNDAAIATLDTDKIELQLKLQITELEFGYFKGSVYVKDGVITGIIDIETDGYIDENHNITFKTNYGSIYSPAINLLTQGELSLYTTEEIDLTNNDADVSEIKTNDATSILYKQIMTIEFGKYLNNLYTTYNLVYTNRKFLTYEENVYLKYKEDIYELDSDGLPKFKEIDTDGDGFADDITPIIKHKKGDYVLDENGEKIIVHKKGDTILDEDGKPIVDTRLGMEHYLTMLLFDDCFLRATDDEHKLYRLNYFLELTNTIYNNINDLNKDLIDNSEFKFLSYSSCKNVELVENNKITSYPNFIEPEVTIYVAKDTTFLVTEDVEKIVYATLRESLKSNTTVNTIENNIETMLGDRVLSVKLKDTGNIDTNSIIYNEDSSSKFIIKKGLYKLDTNHTIVKPVIKINVISI